MLIKSIIEFGTPEYHESIVLRDAILRKPLKMEFTEEQLSNEYDSFHIGIYDKNLVLIGCLVLKPLSDNQIKMRQVAVSLEHQSKGVGKELVKFSEVFAKSKGFTLMELHARDTACPFYDKLAYNRIGDSFEEVGINHYRYEKTL